MRYLPFVLGALVWVSSLSAGDDLPKGSPIWKVKTKNKIENVIEVLKGTAFFTRENDYVTVIGAADGKIVWEKKLAGFNNKISVVRVFDELLVYTTKKELITVKIADGSELSKTPIKSVDGKEVDAGDFVESLQTPNGTLDIYKTHTTFIDLKGNVLWTRDDKNMTASSYKVFKNGNFAAFYSKSVAMIDHKTGTALWSRKDEGFAPSDYHQLNSGHFLVFYSKSFRLVGFDAGNDLFASTEPASSNLLYTWSRSNHSNSAVAVFGQNKAYLVSGADGKLLWSSDQKGSETRGGTKKTQSCVDFSGQSAVFYLEKQVVCVNMNTGAATWVEDIKDKEEVEEMDVFTSETEGDQPARAFLSVNKTLLAFNPADGSKTWQTHAGTFAGHLASGIAMKDGDWLLVSGRRAFLMTNKELGIHIYRVDLKNGTIKWHHQTRAGFTNALGHNVKTTWRGVASGPYVFPDKDLVVLVSNIGLSLIRYSDGQYLDKKGKWSAPVLGDMKFTGTSIDDYKMLYTFMHTPPATGPANIVNMYVSSWNAMRSANLTNLNPDPILVGNTLYVAAAMDDKIWAVDVTSGKKLWESKVGGPVLKLPISSGMVYKDGNIFVRTGFYLDENILYAAQNPKPVAYGDKGDFGFVGIEGSTGKVMWKYQDFDKMDPVYLVEPYTSKEAAEKAQNGPCSQKKLKLGLVTLNINRPNYTLLGGGSGFAGIQGDGSDPCKSNWHAPDDFTAASATRELATGQTAIFMYVDQIKRGILTSNSNIFVVDESSMRVLWKAKKESPATVPLLLSNQTGLLLDVDGKEMSAYSLMK